MWQQLEPLLPGLSIEVLARVESTNSLLLERARVANTRSGPTAAADAPDSGFGRRAIDARPCLLVAEQQTLGRGRLGRRWHSEAGASLTFSLSLPMATQEWSGLSLAVGVMLADALDPPRQSVARTAEVPRSNIESFDPPRIGLKWPNDLWLADGSDRKIGGILIETVPMGSQRLVVIGIGLNLSPQPQAPESACLQDVDIGLDAPGCLAKLAPPLVLALRQFEREGFAPFAARFAARDVLRGRVVTTTSPEVPGGVAAGVTPRGELCVRAGDTQHLLSSGEISVRPAPADRGEGR